jgi:hypothetical protein
MVAGLLAVVVCLVRIGGERAQAQAATLENLQTVAADALGGRYAQLLVLVGEAAGTCRNPRRRTAPSGAKATADDPIWKTITLGTYANARGLREALLAAQCGIGDLAGDILYRPAFKLSKTRMEVDLVVRSVAELGFGADGASLTDIYLHARERGLELCPAETAAQLRLQYPDQPLGELLHIAMEPVVTSAGEVAHLILGNDGAELFIVAGSAPGDLMLAPTVQFVFVRPE